MYLLLSYTEIIVTIAKRTWLYISSKVNLQQLSVTNEHTLYRNMVYESHIQMYVCTCVLWLLYIFMNEYKIAKSSNTISHSFILKQARFTFHNIFRILEHVSRIWKTFWQGANCVKYV